MRRFDDDENDEFNDDFMNRWEEFNRLMNDRQFNRDINRFRSDLEELMRMISEQRNNGLPFNFKFTPLNDPGRNDFNIPEGEMDTEKGEDENGEWESKKWTSPDGSFSFSSFSRSSSYDQNDSSDEMSENWGSKFRDSRRMPPEESKEIKLKKLNKSLEYLVEQEKYEKAAEIKKIIDELNLENEK